LDNQREAVETKEETTLNIKSISADQETPSKGFRSENRERAMEEGIQTEPSPIEKKE
jgi:hypothetical protein